MKDYFEGFHAGPAEINKQWENSQERIDALRLMNLACDHAADGDFRKTEDSISLVLEKMGQY